MSRLLTVLAKAGDAWDTTVAAIAATPGRVSAALAVRRHRMTALITAALAVLVYLFSIGNLAVSGSGRFTGAPVVRAAPGQLLDARAPYLFEPVLAWHPTGHVAVFVSPVNLLLGSVVAALVGCNIAVAAHTARQAASCRRTRYARLLGVLPAFLLGFACCVPAFLLVLGASTAAALLPVLIPLRPVFYPLTLLMLTGTLVWGTSRASRSGRRTHHAGDTGDAATPAPLPSRIRNSQSPRARLIKEAPMAQVQEVDVVVIGMGVGGEHAAERLAEEGLDVVGVEAELVGGECPYWACIPSKMMIRAGNLLAEARRIPGMAGDSQVVADFAPVAARIRDEATDDWNDQVAVDRFTGKGGHFVRGRARLAGHGRVEADGQEFAVRRAVVLATGSRPQIPPVPGLEEVPYWTNRQAVSVKEPPLSLLVLGGGAVGVELAQAFARFGTAVTVVEAMERLLPAEEPEVGALLADVLEGEGITVRAGARATGVRHVDDVFRLTLKVGEEVTGQQLLVATGRQPHLAGLGLESVGLDPQARALAVDGQMRAAEGVWGVGDVTGRGLFTHVAMYQAEIAVHDILGRPGPEAAYRALPRVTFTDPEVGSVGLTEHAAREQGLRLATGTARVPSSARGWIHKTGNDGLIKLVEDTDRGVLIGGTSAGPAGGEVLYGLALAVQAEIPVDRLRHMMFAYPTFHRAVEDALADLGHR